jgi:hypothetical protein
LIGSRFGIGGMLAGSLGGYIAGGQLGDRLYTNLSRQSKEQEELEQLLSKQQAFNLANQYLNSRPQIIQTQG